MGDVRQGVFHRPGVFGFGAGQGQRPLGIGKVGDQAIQQGELLDGALDDFFTGVVHKVILLSARLKRHRCKDLQV